MTVSFKVRLGDAQAEFRPVRSHIFRDGQRDFLGYVAPLGTRRGRRVPAIVRIRDGEVNVFVPDADDVRDLDLNRSDDLRELAGVVFCHRSPAGVVTCIRVPQPFLKGTKSYA